MGYYPVGYSLFGGLWSANIKHAIDWQFIVRLAIVWQAIGLMSSRLLTSGLIFSKLLTGRLWSAIAACAGGGGYY